MKNYERIIELGCFSLGELAEKLNCCIPTAASLIQQYLKNGYIERIHRDLYVAISIESKQPILSRYQIGSRLAADAYVSHHSAFEVYGYANQVFYEVYVATETRFTDFVYNGIVYHRIAPKTNADTININGVKVSSVEQTVVDSICDIEKIGGLEETIRSILLIPSLNADKLLEVLKNTNNGFVYQKCGSKTKELFRKYFYDVVLYKERSPGVYPEFDEHMKRVLSLGFFKNIINQFMSQCSNNAEEEPSKTGMKP